MLVKTALRKNNHPPANPCLALVGGYKYIGSAKGVKLMIAVLEGFGNMISRPKSYRQHPFPIGEYDGFVERLTVPYILRLTPLWLLSIRIITPDIPVAAGTVEVFQGLVEEKP